MKHNSQFPMQSMVESLETRRLLAADLGRGGLVITGTNDNDRITVESVSFDDDADPLTDEVAGIQVSIDQGVGTEAVVSTFALTDFRRNRITVKSGRGDDLVDLSGVTNTDEGGAPLFQANVAVGAGNDTVLGTEGDDVISGAQGDDSLVGNGGDDKVSGAAGNDTLEGGAGFDTLNGGGGDDLIDGGDDDDRIVGGGGLDVLVGGLGFDLLNGGGGNDMLDGGDDDDDLRGGGGDDILVGGAGLDIIRGNGGSDDFSDDDTDEEIFDRGRKDDARGDDTLVDDGGGEA